MTYLLRPMLASLATLLIAAHAHAFEAGWMQIQTTGATGQVSVSGNRW